VYTVKIRTDLALFPHVSSRMLLLWQRLYTPR